MKRFYTYTGILVAALALGFVFRGEIAEAAGHISVHNVTGDLRTQRVMYVVPAIAALASTSVTAGTAGVIATPTVNAVTSIASTANTMTFPYPAKLKLQLLDPTANSTLLCTAVVLVGRNQFGQSITETVALPDETEVKSVKVYESLLSYSASGCAAGNEAGDILRIRASNDIGLPFKVTSENAVLSLCHYDISVAAATNVVCYAQATFVTDLVYSAINLDTGIASALAPDDQVIIAVRPPAGY